MLIVLDGVAALGKVPRSYLAPAFAPDHFRVPRVVGFVRADRHLPLADRVGAVELFGCESITVPAHGWVERLVEVVWRRFKGGRASYAPTRSTRKSNNLWNDPKRNALITQVARLLAAGDRAALLAVVPGVADVVDFQVPARVVVVVENQEHADALAPKLPGWPIDAPAAGWMVTEIATFDGLRGRPLDDVDVVVRADGGTGLLPLAPFALASRSSQPARPLLVIDVLDRHHPDLRRAVKTRKQAYVEAGWRPAGFDAVDFALFSLFPERGRQ